MVVGATTSPPLHLVRCRARIIRTIRPFGNPVK